MTITLYWWMIPIILIVIGIYYFYTGEESQYGFDVVKFIVFVTCFVAAISVTLTKLFL